MDYIISVAGLALAGAPWVFGYSSNNTAMWASVILGAVICMVAAYRALTKDTHTWEEWTAGAAGLLAVAAPFLFGVSAPALWSSVILGLIVAGLAAYQVFFAQRRTPAH